MKTNILDFPKEKRSFFLLIIMHKVFLYFVQIHKENMACNHVFYVGGELTDEMQQFRLPIYFLLNIVASSIFFFLFNFLNQKGLIHIEFWDLLLRIAITVIPGAFLELWLSFIKLMKDFRSEEA